MNNTCKILLFLLLAFSSTNVLTDGGANSHFAKQTPLITKDLPDVPGKEGLIETVVLSPGEVVPAHRHNADVFAYVLKGSVVTQSKGGKSQKVHAGEVFTNRARMYTSRVATRVRRNPRRFSSSL